MIIRKLKKNLREIKMGVIKKSCHDHPVLKFPDLPEKTEKRLVAII